MMDPPQSLQVPNLVGDDFLNVLGTKDSFTSSSKTHLFDVLNRYRNKMGNHFIGIIHKCLW